MRLRLLLLFCVAFCVAAGSPAQITQTKDKDAERADKPAAIGKYQIIIDRAPFRNQSVAQTTAGAGNPSPLRLNGIIRIGNEVSAGIEDVVQKKSMVVALGQTKDGLEIQTIDEKNQTASVVYNGQSMKLNIEKLPSQIGGLPLPQSTPIPVQATLAQQPAPANSNQQPAQGQPVLNRRRIIIPREK